MELIKHFQEFSVYVWIVYGCTCLGLVIFALELKRELKVKTAKLKKLEITLQIKSRSSL